MAQKDPRVDEYIRNAAEFAQPILSHLRSLIHIACPDVQETIKWGFPNFDYKGVFCSMAAFKKHCAFTFWKASLMEDKANILSQTGNTAMGQLGKIEKLADLPDDQVLISYLKEAQSLNEKGVKVNKKTAASKELIIPEILLDALEKAPRAKSVFEKFSYSHKKEYVDWLNEAKREETKSKRLGQIIEMLSEGKTRNWKYE